MRRRATRSARPSMSGVATNRTGDPPATVEIQTRQPVAGAMRWVRDPLAIGRERERSHKADCSRKSASVTSGRCLAVLISKPDLPPAGPIRHKRRAASRRATTRDQSSLRVLLSYWFEAAIRRSATRGANRSRVASEVNAMRVLSGATLGEPRCHW